jgi:hypothetical protein
MKKRALWECRVVDASGKLSSRVTVIRARTAPRKANSPQESCRSRNHEPGILEGQLDAVPRVAGRFSLRFLCAAFCVLPRCGGTGPRRVVP